MLGGEHQPALVLRMTALRLSDLLLRCPCSHRAFTQIVLEHSQDLVRGVSQAFERSFLCAGVDRLSLARKKVA
jgi:hypothetical protein